MRALGLFFFRALPGLALWAVAGCQLLIDGEITSIHCTEEGVIGLGACPANHICKEGACVELKAPDPPTKVYCDKDDQCAPGDFCLDTALLELPSGKRCSRPCCSSISCDPTTGFVCWAPPTGGASFCVDPALVGLAKGGIAASGQSCNNDSDCRSGSCAADGTCLDSCCSDTSCAASDSTCQFGERGRARGFFCAPRPKDKSPFLADCKTDDDCDSGICLKNRCSAPCCNSDMCGVDTREMSLTPIACQYIQHGGVLIRACAHTLEATMVSAVGQPCAEDNHCRGGICIRPSGSMEQGYCSDACCSDAFCGEGGGFQCRPTQEDTSWDLRCERK
jgi:hypothetical protein